MCERLGACFKPEILKPYFTHSITKSKVYTNPDNADAIKTLRNTFSNYDLINAEGADVKFAYMFLLHDYQQEEGLLGANKPWTPCP